MVRRRRRYADHWHNDDSQRRCQHHNRPCSWLYNEHTERRYDHEPCCWLIDDDDRGRGHDNEPCYWLFDDNDQGYWLIDDIDQCRAYHNEPCGWLFDDNIIVDAQLNDHNHVCCDDYDDYHHCNHHAGALTPADCATEPALCVAQIDGVRKPWRSAHRHVCSHWTDPSAGCWSICAGAAPLHV